MTLPAAADYIEHERRRDALGRALAFDVRRSRRPPRVEPDDGRRHRRDRRPHDPRSASSGSPTSRRATTSASTSTRRSSRRSLRPLHAWGTHPSWSRLLGSPVLYEQIEERLTELLGLRGLARPADDHAHPRLGDSGARRLGHDLPRRPRPQDDLRRLRDRPRARARPSDGSAANDPDDLELLHAPGSLGRCESSAWTASTA